MCWNTGVVGDVVILPEEQGGVKLLYRYSAVVY